MEGTTSAQCSQTFILLIGNLFFLFFNFGLVVSSRRRSSSLSSQHIIFPMPIYSNILWNVPPPIVHLPVTLPCATPNSARQYKRHRVLLTPPARIDLPLIYSTPNCLHLILTLFKQHSLARILSRYNAIQAFNPHYYLYLDVKRFKMELF